MKFDNLAVKLMHTANNLTKAKAAWIDGQRVCLCPKCDLPLVVPDTDGATVPDHWAKNTQEKNKRSCDGVDSHVDPSLGRRP